MSELHGGPNPPAPFPEGKGEDTVVGLSGDVVSRQKVTRTKLQIAKELRSEMTPEEKLLWTHLRGNKLGRLHFRRQQVIAGFIVDFYCHSARLVIEVDGDIHQDQFEQDAARDQILKDHGLRIFRVSNQEIRYNRSAVLQRILSLASPPPSLQGRGLGG